jgi:hypothetical protein
MASSASRTNEDPKNPKGPSPYFKLKFKISSPRNEKQDLLLIGSTSENESQKNKQNKKKQKVQSNPTNFGPIRWGVGQINRKYGAWQCTMRNKGSEGMGNIEGSVSYDFHVSYDLWGITSWGKFIPNIAKVRPQNGVRKIDFQASATTLIRCFPHRGRSTTLVLTSIGHFWTVRTLSIGICLVLYSKKIPYGAFDPPHPVKI